MFIRSKILSEVFTNLGVGWLALVIITPSPTILSLLHSVMNGIICLLIAETILRLEESYDFR